jgi:hypothetical protein
MKARGLIQVNLLNRRLPITLTGGAGIRAFTAAEVECPDAVLPIPLCPG